LLSTIPINWYKIEIEYLLNENYIKYMDEMMKKSKEILVQNVLNEKNGELKIVYNTKESFVGLANFFKVMNDFKRGVPRCAYNGIVIFRYNSNRIFLVPTRPKLTYE
jgi:hypothetical protein